MNILKKSENGFTIVSAITISDDLAKSFEYCGSLKKKVILQNFPLFDKFEIKDNFWKGEYLKTIVVTSKEVISTNLDDINKLAELQSKAIKTIIRKEVESSILDRLVGKNADQLVNMNNINETPYGSKEKEN